MMTINTVSIVQKIIFLDSLKYLCLEFKLVEFQEKTRDIETQSLSRFWNNEDFCKT